ncbi:hypothetical protein AA103581_1857 [Gluconobacter wancherniae NBRC 103581]|nr:hypothetical protein AA103581_1857 [Gluconobacter wancherniae NBRC 103581]
MRRNGDLAASRVGIVGIDVVSGQKPVETYAHYSQNHKKQQHDPYERAAFLLILACICILLSLLVGLLMILRVIVLIALRHKCVSHSEKTGLSENDRQQLTGDSSSLTDRFGHP